MPSGHLPPHGRPASRSPETRKSSPARPHGPVPTMSPVSWSVAIAARAVALGGWCARNSLAGSGRDDCTASSGHRSTSTPDRFPFPTLPPATRPRL